LKLKFGKVLAATKSGKSRFSLLTPILNFPIVGHFCWLNNAS
jgi:hypothetical protein